MTNLHQPPAIFISGCCEGEFCTMCGTAAAHKVAEEIQYDDPFPARHGFTAYVCHECFVRIMGAAARNETANNKGEIKNG